MPGGHGGRSVNQRAAAALADFNGAMPGGHGGQYAFAPEEAERTDFNGAMPGGHGGPAVRVNVSELVAVLQWGHARRAWRAIPRMAAASPVRRTSMGPCPEGMEGQTWVEFSSPVNGHFNGAMPGGHGGPVPLTNNWQFVPSLQWGHARRAWRAGGIVGIS